MRDDRKEDILPRDIIAAAIEVHRELGPGLLESSYEECLCHELKIRSISYGRQKSLPVSYKEIRLDCGYLLDVVVDNLVIVEIKAVESMLPIHTAQLLTYLRLANLKLGLRQDTTNVVKN
jgi:GxxExxY protein